MCFIRCRVGAKNQSFSLLSCSELSRNLVLRSTVRSIGCQNCAIYNDLQMCGRYRLSRRKQIIEEHFQTAPWEDDWEPHFNVAPTQPIPVIRQHPREPVRQISTMRWDLFPIGRRTPLALEARSTLGRKLPPRNLYSAILCGSDAV